MGFWGTLGKIASIAGPAAATVFTGGAAAPTLMGTIARIAGSAAPVLAGMAQGQASKNAQGDAMNLSRDQINQNKFRIDQELPGRRMDDSLRASLIKNRQPVKMNWAGPGSGLRPGGGFKIEGGMSNPDLIDPRTQQTADDVIYQRLQEQLGRQGAPGATPGHKEGFGEKLLGGAATATGLMGAFRDPNAGKPIPTIRARPVPGAGDAGMFPPPNVGSRPDPLDRMTQVFDEDQFGFDLDNY